jgi:[ribosomal protein S5]-alanine N-acetyltransferase
MEIQLIPIQEHLDNNREFLKNPLCQESLYMAVEFFQQVGYQVPWIGYFAILNKEVVGSGAFKGPPQNNAIEIAYGTFEPFRQRGIGAAICEQLVQLALKTDPCIKITARTLPDNYFSARILEKNRFRFTNPIIDPEDGEVFEWVYRKD